MIITVTDAKDLTRKVEQNIDNATTIAGFYTSLFSNHVSRITDNTHVDWGFIKTTGDGLVIISKPQPGGREDGKFFESWLTVVYELFHKFEDPAPIRVIAHWCEEGQIFRGLEIDWKAVSKAGYCITDLDAFSKRVEADIFGPEVNLAFRALGLISGTVFVITENLMLKLASINHVKDVVSQTHLSIGEFNFGPPVPVTHLKGIYRYGFTDDVQQTRPLWLWEVSKCQQQM